MAGDNTGGNKLNPSESAPNGNGENPATGITVSCLPLVTSLVVVTAAAKRKKK